MPPNLIWTRALLLAKIETSYGVDATPVVATNTILAGDLTIEPVSKKLERNNVKTAYGAQPKLIIGEGYKVTFKTELKGSGAAGTPPEIGPLFRACNHTETIVAATSATYKPNSANVDGESASLYFWRHNIRHKILGSRGSFSAELKAREYGIASWEFTGVYAAPSDTSIETGVPNATMPARFVSAAFALHSYNAIIENLKININNEIAVRPSANAANGILEYFIKERNVSGECDPEAVTLATKNWWTIWTAGTAAALTAALGSVAGNILTITGPKVQLDDLKYGDRESLLTYALPLIFQPNAGNDEISFAFT